VIAAFQNETGHAVPGILRGVDLMLVRKPAAVELLIAARGVKAGRHALYQDTDRLIKWAQLTNWAWNFTAFAFVALTLGDLLPAGPAAPWRSFREVLGAPFVVGDIWGNLPGRCVALTFAITAVTYYINIFATLAPRRCPDRIGKVADKMARPCLPVALFAGVLVTMLYDPDAWPFCAGIAGVVVVLTNYSHHKLAERARATGVDLSTNTVSSRFFMANFAEWWSQAGYYSASLFVIGILLGFGWAQDGPVYAVLVCLINMLAMYRSNCTKLAPWVRGNLSRAVCTLERTANIPSPLETPATTPADR